MSVASCRREVRNAEALFTARLVDTHNSMHRLITEVRAAATPVRVAVSAVVAGATLYIVRPRFSMLMRIPLVIGAVDSLVQHFGKRIGDDVAPEPGAIQ